MHFALSCIVHCNSLVCDSNKGERCFIFSPNLGGFCFSGGGLRGRVFIQTGAFAGGLPGAGPVGLAVDVAPPTGAVEWRFSMPVASAGPEVVLGFIGRVRLVRRSITLCCEVRHRTWRTGITKN